MEPERDWKGAGRRIAVGIRRVTGRALFWGLLWWVISEGASPFTPLGAAGVAVATLVSLRMTPPSSFKRRMNVRAMAGFLVFFLRQSFLGGVDVAWRALSPGPAVHPVVIRYRLQMCSRVHNEKAVAFFVLVVSLLPGTAGVDLQGDEVSIHLLDETLGGQDTLRDLERRVARLFGLDGDFPVERRPSRGGRQ